MTATSPIERPDTLNGDRLVARVVTPYDQPDVGHLFDATGYFADATPDALDRLNAERWDPYALAEIARYVAATGDAPLARLVASLDERHEPFQVRIDRDGVDRWLHRHRPDLVGPLGVALVDVDGRWLAVCTGCGDHSDLTRRPRAQRWATSHTAEQHPTWIET